MTGDVGRIEVDKVTLIAAFECLFKVADGKRHSISQALSAEIEVFEIGNGVGRPGAAVRNVKVSSGILSVQSIETQAIEVYEPRRGLSWRLHHVLRPQRIIGFFVGGP
ncbi:hypothetical protein ABQF29_03800 [Mycolicibacter minnesotensis]